MKAVRSGVVFASSMLLYACGGGGGGGGSNLSPTPTVTLSPSATTIAVGQAVTLTWSSTNATSCTASGGWSGGKPTSGSESSGAISTTTTFTLTCGSASQSVTVTAVPAPTAALTSDVSTVSVGATAVLTWTSTNASACTATGGWTGARATAGSDEIRPLTATTTFTLSCTGAGGTSPPQSVTVTVNPLPAGSALVSGKIQFQRVPFDVVSGNGLNPDAPVDAPARDVVVEALGGGGAAIATTTTNGAGDYALVVPANSTITLRARAQMLRSGAGGWNFQVLNNMGGNALYTMVGTAFNVGTGVTRTLTAPSGWGGTSYTGDRVSGPFAILDSVYSAKELIRGVSNVTFPPLALFWSPNNAPADPLCPSNGTIGTTFYTRGGGNDDCGQPFLEGIYVLGSFTAGDTDEFDQHVIAHEFGHYVEAKFSRSDSIGGEHGNGDKLDLRVAFGEGWGNAFAGMALNDPVYRDSFSGASSEFGFNLEQDDTSFNDGGWFSETSIGEILWDAFDATNESGDSLTLGFGPILNAMAGGQRETPALTSIFSFLDALRDEAASSGAAITQLRNGEQISGDDEFAGGESNSGGEASNLPVYRPVALNQGQQRTCVRATNGTYNKLGNSKFYRLTLATNSTVTINVVGAADPGTPGSVAATDPDIYVYRRGTIAAFSEATGPTESIQQAPLQADTYIIEIYDFDLASGTTPRCMTINVTGT